MMALWGHTRRHSPRKLVKRWFASRDVYEIPLEVSGAMLEVFKGRWVNCSRVMLVERHDGVWELYLDG